MKKKIATVEIECSNSHLIPTFSDFLNELQKRFDIEGGVCFFAEIMGG